jgi:hypothetical protein
MCRSYGWVGLGHTRVNGPPHGSSQASPVTGMVSKRPAHACMGSACQRRCSCAWWPLWRKGWTSVRERGALRSPPTRDCSGWSLRRTLWQPSRVIAFTTCTSVRCPWTNALPESGRSRPARSATPRPLRVGHARLAGAGGARSGQDTAGGPGRRGPHAGHRPPHGAAGRPGGGAGRCAAVPHRRLHGGHHRAADARWAWGVAPAPSRRRPGSHAPLEAAARSPRGPDGPIGPARPRGGSRGRRRWPRG